MPFSPSADLSRRGLLAAGGALGLGALVTACGARSGSASAGGGDGWSFTDDRGRKVTAASRPKRVVAYTGAAAALHDLGLGDQIVGVFGPTRLKDGKPDPMAGDLDIGRLTVIGNAYGEFDIEKYAALEPDLLVTNMFQPGALWFVPDQSKDTIGKLAPSVGITVSRVPLPQPLKHYMELAESLGADTRAKKVTDAKARFQAAAERLRGAANASGRIKVMAASASADLLYVCDPKVYPDLSYFRSLGVDFVQPDKVQGGFFENLSWENANKYPADVILLDSRTAAAQSGFLTGKPAWTNLPAVKTNQVLPWQSEPRMSYAGCAPTVEALATAVRQAKKVS
ncbi:ABC transporter substrate-binding protein [Streptantibioticus rubrisoli]|uniref:ABC transporter substrate-binding protein n=1 Tax=Streptantibioticus rubrisoli TaxID=1387313 RepID=A0ABT1P5Y1_9ACTN|nr:ABC transporter substrate-binding protein [Streptantibioticus rubrisoli]MCQ4040760.1 ABC transporter substrate-binding protein [Streptantibioticus rubrisoli]